MKLFNQAKTFVVIITVLLLTACGPKMKQVKEYIPPMTQQGVVCLNEAEQSRQTCINNNAQQMEQCVQQANVLADDELVIQERHYTRALEDYIDLEKEHEYLMADYEEQKRLIIRDGDLAYVQCSKDVEMVAISQFPECKKHLKQSKRRIKDLREPEAPYRPRPPNRNVIMSQFVKQCEQQQNNCSRLYDQLYVSCGGTINYDSVCIANCN